MTSQTPPPFDPAANWPQETLSYAVGELSREFSSLPIERIVATVTAASQAVHVDDGRVRLLRKARELLRQS